MLNQPPVFDPTVQIHSAAPVYVARTHAVVPWYIWVGAIAVTSSSIGGAWDVSWHRSIGRDTFWTPAHMLIYLCGLLSGIVGLWLVFQCTSSADQEPRASSVSVFGLRAPLGVFLAGWGGLAMLTSAPFDNWWHNAYGLDVKIVSPPHALLILGIRAIAVGMLFLILAALNRAAESGHQGTARDQPATSFRTLQLLFLYLAGLMVGGQMFFLMEYTWDIKLHSASAYVAMGVAVPVLFAMFWQASRFRWAATTTAAVYTLFVIAEILILPLFPAQPKLGPVFYQVTHFVPSKFPHPFGCTCICARSLLAAHPRLEVLADRRRLRPSLHRITHCCRMALRELPYVSSERQPLLRHRLLPVHLPRQRS